MNEPSAPTTSRRRITLLLWIVNLCAICASTLSFVYLSFYMYQVSNSVILSQAVLYAPMVLPVVLVTQMHQIAERVSPRGLLLGANLSSLAACIGIFWLLQDMPLMALIGGVVIGTLDAVQRVARIVAIKRYFKAEDVKNTVPLTLTAQFIAGGIAGATLGTVRSDMTPMVALIITCTLFAGAAVATALLPMARKRAGGNASSQRRALWPAFVALMRANPSLRRSFCAFVAFVSVYQGFYNMSRVTLPAHVLQLSEGYVGLLQLVGSVAALVGALAYSRLGKHSARLHPVLMAGASAAFMMGAASGVGIISSYTAYFAFMFFFELAFFRLQSDVVLNSPPQDMPLVAAVQYAGVYLGMITTIFFGSLLVAWVGLGWASAVFVSMYGLAMLLSPDLLRPAAQAA